MPKRSKNKKTSKKKGQKANSNPGPVSVNPAGLWRQLQSTHLHKLTGPIYLSSDSSSQIIAYSDLAAALISAPNFKQLSYVYARYRVEAVHFNIMSLSPQAGPGATPLYLRYAPNIAENPVTEEQITDTVGNKVLNPNKITMTPWCFKPRFSSNITDPPQPTATPDQDGYLPFSSNSFGFVQPFMGSVQYWQNTASSIGEKEWQITYTFFTRCTFSQ